MNNQLQINPPKGYEIDQDKSDLSKGVVYFIKEVKKVFTYKDLGKKLFDNPCYYISEGDSINVKINYASDGITSDDCDDDLISMTKDQLESILALNKLCNVAKYLNGEWLPKIGEEKFAIYNDNDDVEILRHNSVVYGLVYFKTRRYAEEAIEILGEEIHKALILNH